MSELTIPVTETIQKRFSCRKYIEKPIAADERRALQEYAESLHSAPFGTRLRFRLIAATEQDNQALNGLGTYGGIQGARGFIVGAVKDAKLALEDYGYAMEQIVLFATHLGLGTCWLGGNFTKSSFAKKIEAGEGEDVPAVTAVGYIPDEEKARNAFGRRQAKADTRLPWESLFFENSFASPLSRPAAGVYTGMLDMLRAGPSASNKQPWRVVKDGSRWHFYLQRTPGYPPALFKVILPLSDMQRLDMGIAMCHFELTCTELGLGGEWQVQEPSIEKVDELTEYTATWLGV